MSSNSLARLAGQYGVVFPYKEAPEAVDVLFHNSMERESRRDPEDRRSPETLIEHAARGVGAEVFLRRFSDVFSDFEAPLVYGQGMVDFLDKKVDLKTLDGLKVEVKTTTHGRGVWYVSRYVLESLMASTELVDCFLVVETCPLDETRPALAYGYVPKFVILARSLNRKNFKPARYGFAFDHEYSVSRGVAWELTDHDECDRIFDQLKRERLESCRN